MSLEKYFQSFEDYFWEWEWQSEDPAEVSEFESISIPDGNTISFEKFIIEVLEFLSAESFPPFGSLLLVITATNENAEDSLLKIRKLITNAKDAKSNTNLAALQETFEFLDKLKALPSEYKKLNKRKFLFQTIFNNCHNRVSNDKAVLILEQYKAAENVDLIQFASKVPFNKANFVKDFRTIALLNIKFQTTESILKAMESLPNLPELSSEIEIQEIAKVETKSLVQELIEDSKTFYVGSLIRHIWSGLSISFHHSSPSNQPLGGVSDLTNKGDFDKLLISEFANDDDVFMSRIANYEALYIQREVPPESNELIRIILIDATIFNWGTPKTIAIATALAIAKHPKTDIECKIFALGNEYNEIYYDSINDIIDGLNHISSKPEASIALQSFFEDNKKLKAEIFLISTDDALKTENMQRVVYENYEKLKYIIKADELGQLNINKIKNKGQKNIQNINLPLDELWKNPPTNKINSKNHFKTTNPLNEFPILVPLPKSETQVFYFDDTFYLLGSNSILYKTNLNIDYVQLTNLGHIPLNNYNGAEILFENISFKSNVKFTLGKNKNEDFILISFIEKQNQITYLNLNTKEFAKSEFKLIENLKDLQLCYVQGSFYVQNLFNKVFYKIDLESKNLLLIFELGRNVDLINEIENTNKIITKFRKIGNDVYKNMMPIYINENGLLQINKYQLKLNNYSFQNSNFRFEINRDHNSKFSAKYERNRFTFVDGSYIEKDKNGILILTSSNPEIEVIYIPITLNFNLGLATKTYFCGNLYFNKNDDDIEVIDVLEFNEKCLQPFISNILSYVS